MDMTGERRIPAPRQVVWDALNDPAVLKSSIPGCDSLEKLSDDQMKATAAVKIGPISARFAGKVQLTDIDAPNGYRISGEGQGGVAGFAKGGANVALTDDGPDTLLRYQVNAQVGGKIAQLGARLIDATAKQMADAFFDRFSAQVAAMAPAGTPTPAEMPTPAGTPTPAEALAPAGLLEQGVTRTGLVETGPVGAPAHVPPPSLAAVEPIHTPLHVPPPSSISLFALIPREPFDLPMAFWVGGGVFVVMLILMLGSMVK
jgi:uncharacterized protein